MFSFITSKCSFVGSKSSSIVSTQLFFHKATGKESTDAVTSDLWLFIGTSVHGFP